MKAILAKAIRQLLFIAGGAVGAKAAASESDIDIIASAVMVLGSLAWSWWNEYSKRRSAARLAATAGLLALIGMTGCATAPTADQLQRVQDITRASVQSAVTLQLAAFPQHRPFLEGAQKSVTSMIAQGKVTASALGALINTLPLDPNVVRYTASGLLVFDTLSVFWINPATDAALMAAAIGIRDGLNNALAASAPKAAPRSALRAPNSPAPPPPTAANTKRL